MTERCEDCEWVDISTWGEMATDNRQYVLTRPCRPEHTPPGELYASARRRYVETGDSEALTEMLEHVEESR